MEVMVEGVILAVVQLLIFYDLGFLLPVTKTDGKTSIAETTLSGFLLYTTVLELVALFATWLCIPQHIFFYIWGVVLSFCIVASLVWNASAWGHRFHFFLRHMEFQPMLFVVCGAVIGECIIAASRTGQMSGVIAQMATDLEMDAMSLYAPSTGEIVTSISTAELLSRWQLGGEFFSALLGMHPSVYAHVTGSIVTVVLSAMVVYRIGIRLFDGHVMSAYLASLVTVLANVFFTTDYTASGLLLNSGFSKDALLANVILPVFFLLAAAIYEQEDWRHLFWLVFCAGVSGFCVSEYAFFLMPAACLVCILPAVVFSRKWVGMFWTLLLTLVMTSGALFVYFIPIVPFGR